MTNEQAFSELSAKVKAFADARDWSQFHDAKNLTMALCSEVGELAAVLRWVRSEDVDASLRNTSTRARMSEEIGDVGILLLLLCSRAGIDLEQAIRQKLKLNQEKYPVEESRGKPEAPSEGME